MPAQFGSLSSAFQQADLRRVQILFLAGSIGALSFFGGGYWIYRNQLSHTNPAIESIHGAPFAIGTVSLFTLEKDVEQNAPVSSMRIREVPWPRHQVPEGAIRDRSELKDLFAGRSIKAGEPLVRGQFSDRQGITPLKIPHKGRAVTFEVDPSAAIEGHVHPGTQVDIVLSYVDQGVVKSRVIVPNALVLSYGGRTERSFPDAMVGKSLSPTISRTITVGVSAEDGLEIITARKIGQLNLMMRESGDSELGPVIAKDANEVIKKDKEKPGSASCSHGTAKVDGLEFLIACDNTFRRVVPGSEP